MVLKLWHFLSNLDLDWYTAFHLQIFMIISFQTCTCKWQENVGHCVIKITCSADRGLIILKHTSILYFKGAGWILILNTFLCCISCLCARIYAHLPVNVCTVSRVGILYFSTVPAAAHRHSAFGLRCTVPAGTQPIRTSAPFLKNNQQPIRTSTLSNSYLAAVQEGLISPSQNNPSHHWYLPHTSTLTWGERQWQVWFNVRLNCY